VRANAPPRPHRELQRWRHPRRSNSAPEAGVAKRPGTLHSHNLGTTVFVPEMHLTRRHFVKHGGLWLAAVASGLEAACEGAHAPHAADGATRAPPFAPYGFPGPRAEPLSLSSGDGCQQTENNIEGPYYRPGAPMRAALADSGTKGTPLVVRGRVVAEDCRAPLVGALLDIWQADADGRYDNDGHDGSREGPIQLRGKVLTAEDGSYEFRSIVPGRYLNGPQYRPSHVHVKVSAPGRRPLTTQLYFEGDPYNAVDPFIRPSLIMRPVRTGERLEARFDFVLPRAS
jgi:protocatechuate 3,4-dioxygenase beta subunit